MSRIKIDRYSSTEYNDPSLNIFKKAIVVAWGTIDGETHTYAEVQPLTDIGVVPREFVDDAYVAFLRAMYRKDNENLFGNGPIQPKRGQVSNWISVENRLPDDVGIVMYATESGYVSSCRFRPKGTYHACGFRCFATDKELNATYWMPLPEPPEKGI